MKTLEPKGIVVLVAAIAALFAACRGPAEKAGFDIVIKGAKIIDGTGNPWFYGDVGIRGDTIAAVGDLAGRPAGKIITAEGLVVAPGFIDVHTHCDSGFGRPETRANVNYVTQGVTTVVTGNCGYGPLAIAETAERWNKAGMGTNAAILVGLGTVRERVMGDADRRPTPGETSRMKALVEKAMREGAFGVSTGLQYIPGKFVPTEEIVELARVAAAAGGLYATHMRSEEENLVPAVEEAIRIGREAGLRVEISHLKSSGRPNWGRLKDAVQLVAEARATGLEITADIYPYNKSATTTLETIFNIPDGMEPFAGLRKQFAGEKMTPDDRGRLEKRFSEELTAALADPARRAIIRKATEEGLPGEVNWVAKGGWDNFTIMFSGSDPSLIGRMFRDVAAERHRAEFDIAADLYSKEGRGLLISLSAMSEDDVRLGLSQSWTMISSDGESIPPGTQERVHPRNYATFPRVLSFYVRDAGLLGLEDAVRKMTSLPAQLLRLRDRGLVAAGRKADLIVFDPAAVKDKATYLEPHQFSAGIVDVYINGRQAVENGKFNGTLAGKTLLAEAGGSPAGKQKKS